MLSKGLILLLFGTFSNLCSATSESAQKELVTTLKCERGESHLFRYDSSTKLWGPLEEGVKISAFVEIHCMGKDGTNSDGSEALKYMVKLSQVKATNSKQTEAKLAPKARRSRRGAGDWFKNAWVTVKKFFVKVFSKNEGRESRIKDIEAEFDKLPPPGSRSGSKTCRSKAGRTDDREKEGVRIKRAAVDTLFDSMFDIPFQYVQNSYGKITDVRFSEMETDESVKNFKKHLVDTFATQLVKQDNRTMETSPLGQHMTRYVFDKDNVQNVLLTAESGFAKIIRRFFSPAKVEAGAPEYEIVRDFGDKDMMKLGSGKEMIYDPSQLNIEVKQIQKITEGHMTQTVGHLSVKLAARDEVNESRPKRSIDSQNVGLSGMMNVKTQYSMKMISRRKKRAADVDVQMRKLKETESKLNFVSESLVSTSSQEKMTRERLEALREELASALASFSMKSGLDFFHAQTNPDYSKLLEVLDLEQYLNKSAEPTSVSNAIRSSVTERALKEKCGFGNTLSLRTCDDVLIVLSRAGSSVSANYLLNSLEIGKPNQKSSILKLLIHINNPSNELVKRLLNEYSKETGSQSYKGQLLTVITAIASKKSTNEITRNLVKVKLGQLLKTIDCNSNESIFLDILEAAGNLAEEQLIPDILNVGRSCFSSPVHQTATIHALKKLVQDLRVQKWYKDLLLKSTPCHTKRAIVSSLEAYVNLDTTSSQAWPKYGFNKIDQILLNILRSKNSTGKYCLADKVIRYFSQKINARELDSLKIENSQGGHRQKRAILDSFWDDSHCKDFIKGQKEGSVDVPVVRDSLARFRESEDIDVQYTKRRKCTAYKEFGPKGANARVTADVINDITGSRENPGYKLLARLAFGSHFLGKDIDVGKLFWRQDKDQSRAYVNIFGQTLLDRVHKRCNPESEEPYKYTKYIPLYDFTVWLAEISLGIRLDGQMSLQRSDCTARSADDKDVLLSPSAQMKASGEASAKVLIFKGGIEVGGDFNYFSEIKYRPDPELCLSAYNGHHPMNVTVMPWFQMWDLSCGEWSERSAWRPKNLNWELKAKERSAWIEDECLLRGSKRGEISRYDP